MVLSLASLLSEREGVTLYIEYRVEKKRSKNQKPKTPPQTTTLLVLPHPLLLHACSRAQHWRDTLERPRGEHDLHNAQSHLWWVLYHYAWGVFWSIFPSTGDTCVRGATAEILLGDAPPPPTRTSGWRTYVGLRSARRRDNRGGGGGGRRPGW